MQTAEGTISAGLESVQETLLIPLYMRARETSRPDAICRDEKAVEIVSRLDYDFAKFERHGESMQLDIAIRTEILDELVADFLNHHPDGLVVNLGAGLDGRFERLDNGRVVWFELDLPDVIALRRKFYRETLRNPFVAGSVLDQTWFDVLGRRSGQPLLLIAEGLLPYLPGERVWQLFGHIADFLPGAEFLFQSISPGLVHREALVPTVNQTSASFEWGVRSGEEVAKRDARFEHLGDSFYLDRHTNRWAPVLRQWWYVPNLSQQMREIMKITRLRVRG